MSDSMLPAQAAAHLLWAHWQAGSVLDDLPAGERPQSRAEGYAIQAALESLASSPLIGWKIAATSEAGQKHINAAGPMAGRLFAERMVDPNEAISLTNNRMRVAEAEFCFRLGNDLPPRDNPYSVDDALAATEALHVAIEVPDSRFVDFTVVGEAQLIADNACAHQFILGPEAPPEWRTTDLSAFPVTVIKNGSEISEGGGWNVLGDPRIALAWLINELSDLGITATAGQVITTGTSTVPVALTPEDQVACDFGMLGSVSASFAD